MTRMRWIALVLSALLFTVTAAACSSDPTAAPEEPAASGSTDEGHDETLGFGEPAEVGDEDRVVEVSQSDEMRFEPASIEVKAGETIRFEVSNTGQTVHEFVLGDAALQAEHEEEMAGMTDPMTMDEPNGIAVEPGTTGTLVWTFSQAGALEYGCHVPGHYGAGMAGSIEVVEG